MIHSLLIKVIKENILSYPHLYKYEKKVKEFVLYYQPKLRSSDHKICSLEALIRWKHPTLGMVSPYKFIKLAEETGLIREIGDWVLKQAFKQLSLWEQKYDSQISVSVNLSPIELYEDDKIEKIKKLQQRYQINRKLFYHLFL